MSKQEFKNDFDEINFKTDQGLSAAEKKKFHEMYEKGDSFLEGRKENGRFILTQYTDTQIYTFAKDRGLLDDIATGVLAQDVMQQIITSLRSNQEFLQKINDREIVYRTEGLRYLERNCGFITTCADAGKQAYDKATGSESTKRKAAVLTIRNVLKSNDANSDEVAMMQLYLKRHFFDTVTGNNADKTGWIDGIVGEDFLRTALMYTGEAIDACDEEVLEGQTEAMDRHHGELSREQLRSGKLETSEQREFKEYKQGVLFSLNMYTQYIKKIGSDVSGIDMTIDTDEKYKQFAVELENLQDWLKNDDKIDKKGILEAIGKVLSKDPIFSTMNNQTTTTGSQFGGRGNAYYSMNAGKGRVFLKHHKAMKLLLVDDTIGSEEKIDRMQSILRMMDENDPNGAFAGFGSSFESSDAIGDNVLDTVGSEIQKLGSEEMVELQKNIQGLLDDNAFMEELIDEVKNDSSDLQAELRGKIGRKVADYLGTEIDRSELRFQFPIREIAKYIKKQNSPKERLETRKVLYRKNESELALLKTLQSQGKLSIQGEEKIQYLTRLLDSVVLQEKLVDTTIQTSVSLMIEHQCNEYILDKDPSIITRTKSSSLKNYYDIKGVGYFNLSDETADMIKQTAISMAIMLPLGGAGLQIGKAAASRVVASLVSKSLLRAGSLVARGIAISTAATVDGAIGGTLYYGAEIFSMIGSGDRESIKKSISLDKWLSRVAMAAILGRIGKIKSLNPTAFDKLRKLDTIKITAGRIIIEEVSIGLADAGFNFTLGDGTYSSEEFMQGMIMGAAFEFGGLVMSAGSAPDTYRLKDDNGKVAEHTREEMLALLKEDPALRAKIERSAGGTELPPSIAEYTRLFENAKKKGLLTSKAKERYSRLSYGERIGIVESLVGYPLSEGQKKVLIESMQTANHLHLLKESMFNIDEMLLLKDSTLLETPRFQLQYFINIHNLRVYQRSEIITLVDNIYTFDSGKGGVRIFDNYGNRIERSPISKSHEKDNLLFNIGDSLGEDIMRKAINDFQKMENGYIDYSITDNIVSKYTGLKEETNRKIVSADEGDVILTKFDPRDGEELQRYTIISKDSDGDFLCVNDAGRNKTIEPQEVLDIEFTQNPTKEQLSSTTREDLDAIMNNDGLQETVKEGRQGISVKIRNFLGEEKVGSQEILSNIKLQLVRVIDDLRTGIIFLKTEEGIDAQRNFIQCIGNLSKIGLVSNAIDLKKLTPGSDLLNLYIKENRPSFTTFFRLTTNALSYFDGKVSTFGFSKLEAQYNSTLRGDKVGDKYEGRDKVKEKLIELALDKELITELQAIEIRSKITDDVLDLFQQAHEIGELGKLTPKQLEEKTALLRIACDLIGVKYDLTQLRRLGMEAGLFGKEGDKIEFKEISKDASNTIKDHSEQLLEHVYKVSADFESRKGKDVYQGLLLPDAYVLLNSIKDSKYVSYGQIRDIEYYMNEIRSAYVVEIEGKGFDFMNEDKALEYFVSTASVHAEDGMFTFRELKEQSDGSFTIEEQVQSQELSVGEKAPKPEPPTAQNTLYAPKPKPKKKNGIPPVQPPKLPKTKKSPEDIPYREITPSELLIIQKSLETIGVPEGLRDTIVGSLKDGINNQLLGTEPLRSLKGRDRDGYDFSNPKWTELEIQNILIHIGLKEKSRSSSLVGSILTNLNKANEGYKYYEVNSKQALGIKMKIESDLGINLGNSLDANWYKDRGIEPVDVNLKGIEFEFSTPPEKGEVKKYLQKLGITESNDYVNASGIIMKAIESRDVEVTVEVPDKKIELPEESPIPIKNAPAVPVTPKMVEKVEPLSPERILIIKDKFNKLFEILGIPDSSADLFVKSLLIGDKSILVNNEKLPIYDPVLETMYMEGGKWEQDDVTSLLGSMGIESVPQRKKLAEALASQAYAPNKQKYHEAQLAREKKNTTTKENYIQQLDRFLIDLDAKIQDMTRKIEGGMFKGDELDKAKNKKQNYEDMKGALQAKKEKASKSEANKGFPNLNVPLSEMERIARLDKEAYAQEIKAFAKKYYDELDLTDSQVEALWRGHTHEDGKGIFRETVESLSAKESEVYGEGGMDITDPEHVKFVNGCKRFGWLAVFKIKIKKRTRVVTKESYAPKFITDKILGECELPPNIPETASNIIGSFITKCKNEGITSNEAIMRKFAEEKINLKIKDSLDSINKKTERLNIESLISEEVMGNIKSNIAGTLGKLGYGDDVLKEVMGIDIIFTRSGGVSTAGRGSVGIDLNQIVRKSLDLVTVFGNEIKFEDAFCAELYNTVGHEIGHVVQNITESGRIPLEWGTDNMGENTSERYAEGRGRYTISNNQEWTRIIRLSRGLQVATVNNVWSSTKDTSIDVVGLFSEISSQYPEIGPFVYARQAFYGGIAPEFYAMPYPVEQLLSITSNR